MEDWGVSVDGRHVARFRLRFLLQEFDLPRGATVIGRSLDCNLTIEDPLVSREHARLVIDDDGERVEDMESRNGVRVNGAQIRGPTRLNDGDRVRIGTQDFVFCRVDPTGKPHSRTTGVLRLCAKCRLPYPREVAACPNCEATEQTDEETLSGAFGTTNQTAWSVQLLVEALERALSLGRTADAERIARRVTAQVEDLLVSGGAIDPKGLAALALQAASTTVATNDPTWVLWVIDVYARIDRVPPLEVVDRLGEAAGNHVAVVRAKLESMLKRLRASARSTSSGDLEALARLEQMRRLFEEEALSPTEVTGDFPRPS